jgi:hypothetical protein
MTFNAIDNYHFLETNHALKIAQVARFHTLIRFGIIHNGVEVKITKEVQKQGLFGDFFEKYLLINSPNNTSLI